MNTLKRTKCFRTRGKKSENHQDPLDLPRRRANNQRGRGTYANDRPPIVGTVGRESGQVRLRVAPNTTGETLEAHVHQFTCAEAIVYTDESNGYNHIIRVHATVEHGVHEYARDDDGDGIREVHCNTAEGMWTGCPEFSASVQRRPQKVSRGLCGDLRISPQSETHFASVYFSTRHFSHFLHLSVSVNLCSAVSNWFALNYDFEELIAKRAKHPEAPCRVGVHCARTQRNPGSKASVLAKSPDAGATKSATMTKSLPWYSHALRRNHLDLHRAHIRQLSG